MAVLDELRARWDAEFTGADPDRSAAAFAEVVARHGEVQRRYHTIEHVAAVLDALDALGASRAARLAGWYHDVIYDPNAHDNEERSARLAARVLPRLGVDDRTVSEVVRLIELTQTHDPEPDDPDGAALVDADLSILGADQATYEAYAAAVRAEYGHVPDELWRAGRASILASFLERAELFHTPAGRSRWEDRARANLRHELTALG